jgi:signal transduction histidine kinase
MREPKILIADDEKDLVDMLAYNLENKGYHTLKTYDGLEAWGKIESECPDLLILDLMMPGIDGWEVCRLIRRHQRREIKEMGILMLTARTQAEDRIYGLELGADDYLTKPFSLAELILRVEKMIQIKKVLTELQEEMGRLRFETSRKEDNLRKVVHDLKNPVLSMGFSAKLLLRDQNGQKSRFLNAIYESSIQLTQWVDSILNYDEISKRRMKCEMKEIEISSLAKQVLDLLKGAGEEKEIQIVFSLPPSLPLLRCDEQLLKRALNNLISNALKYTPRGGKVEVSVIHYDAGSDGGIVEMGVKDTGIGILAEDIERIFEPFYRGKNVDTETGIGLGLSFVKEVVDLHGGRILVQSEPKKGSIFSILLPVGNNPQEVENNSHHLHEN